MFNEQSNIDQQKDAFMRSIRRYGLVSLLMFALSGIMMIGTSLILLAYFDEFDAFFQQRIGGDLGDALKGLSFAAISGLPMILAMVLQGRLTRKWEPRCSICNGSFVTRNRAKAVVQENKCLVCGTTIFSDEAEMKDALTSGIAKR